MTVERRAERKKVEGEFGNIIRRDKEKSEIKAKGGDERIKLCK